MISLVVVDSFAEEPFSGNPAAVCILDRHPPAEWMQLVAREMNLSETAFVAPRPDGDYNLRWFTPSAEVDLCGHATLASAHVLGGTGRFHTRSGLLTCRPGPDGLIEMDFPADPLRTIDCPLDLQGVAVKYCGRGKFDVLVEVDDAWWLRCHRPDIAAIAAIDCRGVIVTAAGDRRGVDFVSRVFAPQVGVAEDPVTGSAHCTLAGFWSERTGRDTLTGYQASERGGTVHARVMGDRVVLGGRAVTVSDVTMRVELPAGP